MKADKQPVVIALTAPTREEAEQIGGLLLKRKLAACVQYENISSHYVWDGEICLDSEVRIVVKTTAECYRDIEEAVLSVHSYECPQILMYPVLRGYRPYLNWLADQIGL